MSETQRLSFSDFLTARHSLWLERTYGLASEVTDQTLREFRFTNLWRELDRGTVYLFNSVQQRFVGDSIRLICHSLLYRLFNLPDPYERVLREFGDSFYLEAEAGDLLSFVEALPVMYSAAYTRQVSMPKTCDQFVRLEERAAEVEKALTAGDAFAVRKALLKIYSIGPFTADQMTMDLCWDGGPFRGSDFAPELGPGAKEGLNICREDGDGDNFSHLIFLGETAVSRETRPIVAGQPISFDMRALEHSLCEFSKYVKTYNRAVSGRAGKRVYSPADQPIGLPYSWGDPALLQQN